MLPASGSLSAATLSYALRAGSPDRRSSCSRWSSPSFAMARHDATIHRLDGTAKHVPPWRPGRVRYRTAIRPTAKAFRRWRSTFHIRSLSNGICLVDTPGLGSVFTESTARTKAFVLVSLLLSYSVRSPLAHDELELIAELWTRPHTTRTSPPRSQQGGIGSLNVNGFRPAASRRRRSPGGWAAPCRTAAGSERDRAERQATDRRGTGMP